MFTQPSSYASEGNAESNLGGNELIHLILEWQLISQARVEVLSWRRLNTRFWCAPCKVAVLIPRGTDFKPVRDAIRYLSWLWGGRFGWIIPVGPDGKDERDMRWLDLYRPDVVYLAGLQQGDRGSLAATACQPMNVAPLTPHVAPAPYTPFPDNLITCSPVLELLYREAALRMRPAFYPVLPVDGHPLAPFVEAVFGCFDATWARTVGPPTASRHAG
jgi:hypothetical protein